MHLLIARHQPLFGISGIDKEPGGPLQTATSLTAKVAWHGPGTEFSPLARRCSEDAHAMRMQQENSIDSFAMHDLHNLCSKEIRHLKREKICTGERRRKTNEEKNNKTTSE